MLERDVRCGGALETIRRDGFVIETGADSFLTEKRACAELAARMGLAAELIPTREIYRKTYVVRAGRLVEIPAGFSLLAPTHLGPVFRSSIFSPLGKLRIALEPFIAARNSDDDESLDSFVTRRLGREVLERVAQALGGGIYTADPKRLSMTATMSRFVEMERRHGSVVKGMRAAEVARASKSADVSGARWSLFQSFKNGMATLPETLAARLGGSIRKSAEVVAMSRNGDAWRLATSSGDLIDADAVICAAPAYAASRIVAMIAPAASKMLGEISYASAATVNLTFRESDFDGPPRAFGFVVPAIERRRIIAGSFSSFKFEGRAPAGAILARAFVGGEMSREMMSSQRHRDGRRGARRVSRAAWSQRGAGIYRSQAMARLDAAVRSRAPGASRGDRARRRNNTGVCDRGRGVSRRGDSRLHSQRRRCGGRDLRETVGAKMSVEASSGSASHWPRVIAHADMDAFYASVEILDNPALRGLPVIVGGRSARGVVTSASYEARKFGVRSAMPTGQARKLCPQAIFVPGRMDRYVEISRVVMRVFESFSPVVEPLSLDEAFIDLTGSERLLGPPLDAARDLKSRVLEETGLVVSVGVAPTKMAAKILSDMSKPDGLLLVAPEKLHDLLTPLPVERLWGVGRVTLARMHECGIKTVGDLARRDPIELKAMFGSMGPHLHELASGIDTRAVIADWQRKSYGEENTFAHDLALDSIELRRVLIAHGDAIARRLRADGVRARTSDAEAENCASARRRPLSADHAQLFTRRDDQRRSGNFADRDPVVVEGRRQGKDSAGRRASASAGARGHFANGAVRVGASRGSQARPA